MQNPVICGNARFSIICPECVRIEYSNSGKFIDEPSLFASKRDMDFKDFTVKKDEKALHIKTSRFELIYLHPHGMLRGGVLKINLPDGKTWKFGAANEHNLGGTVDSLDDVGAPIELGQGLLSRDGWHVIDDAKTPLLIDNWIAPRTGRGRDIDQYFFAYDTDYRAALKALSKVSGKIELPPRCVLGSWYSRWWYYTSKDYREIITEFEQHKFPLDIIVLDMEWHPRNGDDGLGWAGTLGWTGWSWNRELLPDAEELLKWFKAKGLKVVLNVHPHDGIRKHEDMYADFMRALGEDPATGKALQFDAGDKKYMEAYFKYTHTPREQEGVDFWWVDWQQDCLFPEIKSVPGQPHLPWLNWCYYHHRESDNRRGLSFSRWGGWGDHRHPIYFSGDVVSNWDMLAFEVPFTAIAGNVGCFFWSHDMGGFHGKRNEELYARWLQFGVTTASMRCHSAGDELDRRPWKWSAEYTESMRHSFDLRSRLMPYIYSSVRQTCTETVPLNRAMYFEHPEKEEAYSNPQQFYFGDHLLSAPVVSAGVGAGHIGFQTVWFPGGEWYNFFTGEKYSGEQEALVGAGLNEFPLFVRGGAPLVLAEPSMHMTSEQYSRLTVRLYPASPGSRNTSVLYEDDGETRDYQQGKFAQTTLCYENNAGTHILKIGGTEGVYSGQPLKRAYTVELHCVSTVKKVLVNGCAAAFKFNLETNVCSVELPESPLSATFVVEITADEVSAELVRARNFVRRAELLLDKSLTHLTPATIIMEYATPDLLRLAGCGAIMKNENLYLRGDKKRLKFYPGSPETAQVVEFKASYCEEQDDGCSTVFAVEFNFHDTRFPIQLPEFNVTNQINGKRCIEVTAQVHGRQIAFINEA
ncbi:MAG: TIM-barrel domain-containing protein [Victivallaceae bacterium]